MPKVVNIFRGALGAILDGEFSTFCRACVFVSNSPLRFVAF